MKKLLLTVAAALLMIFGLAACTPAGETGGGAGDKTLSDREQGGTITEGKILTVYFSCTNTTKSVAEKIATASGAQLYRIEPETPYTSADLNYSDDDCRANREQNDPAARPAMKGGIDNLSRYDTVFLGYPIWWGTLPKIIYTFLDTYDLSGKSIVPFCTSGGSGIGTSVAAIRREEPQATVLDGRRFTSGTSQSEINTWVEGLNVRPKAQEMKLYFTVGETRLAATLEENAATAALKEKLKASPVTVEMSDYGGFEKVGSFGFDLPASDIQITTKPCDFVLYEGNRLVVFYGSNSWSYTRLGKITGVSADELKAVLGNGSVSVTLSMTGV